MKISQQPGENAEGNNKETPRSASGLKKKFLRSHLSIAVIGIVILAILLIYRFSARNSGEHMLNVTVPMEQATVQILIGVQRSFSALRTSILLQDYKFQKKNTDIWNNEIYPNVKRIRAISHRWPETIQNRELNEINSLLKNLELIQWKISDVAASSGNEPAKYLLNFYANPLENRIFSKITYLINTEASRQGGDEHTILMKHMADFRGYFQKAHSLLRNVAATENITFTHQREEYILRVENALNEILSRKHLLDIKSANRLNPVIETLNALEKSFFSYRQIAEQIQEARQSPKWNLALYWLNENGLPLAEEIDQRLTTLTESQFVKVMHEASTIRRQELFLFILTLGGSLGLGGAAIVLSRKGAEDIVRPITVLSQKAMLLARGERQDLLQWKENNEIGTLIASFNEMQSRLDERTTQLKEHIINIEDKNKDLLRTRKEMDETVLALKNEQKALSKQKKYLEMVIESSPNGMLMMSQNGRIQRVNEVVERLFSYSREELIGQPLEMLIPERFRQGHVGFVSGYLKQPNRRRMGEGIPGATLYGLKKDGSEIPLDVGLGYIKDNNGIVVLAVIQDISDRKIAEDKLEQERIALKKSNLELDSFVYTASHDLKAPLRGIHSFSKFLEEDYAHVLDEEGKNYLSRIRNGADRMTKLIDDLLSLSRISRQKNPFNNTPVEEMLQSVMERIEYDLEASEAELVIQKPMPVIFCDKIKMVEVFLNLMNNAIKFSKKNEKPRVEVGCLERGGCYQFYVKDNGIGIDPQYHKKIFGIFQRLHTREEYEGTGAGLNIVQRVIEDHKGHIWIDSRLGDGATFYFSIPAKTALTESSKKMQVKA